MMSTLEETTPILNHNLSSESRNPCVNLAQHWKGSDSDSSLKLSESSNLLRNTCRVTMNLKTSPDTDDNDDDNTELQAVKVKSCNGNGLVKEEQNERITPSENGYTKTADDAADTKKEDALMDGVQVTKAEGSEFHTGTNRDESEECQAGEHCEEEEQTEEQQSDEQSEESSEKHLQEQLEIQSEVQSENLESVSVHSEEESGVSEGPTDEQSVEESDKLSEISPEETLTHDTDGDNEVTTSNNSEDVADVKEEAGKKKSVCDKTEVVGKEESEDEVVLMVSDKTNGADKEDRSMDSEGGDHPLTIKDKVRNSVRDIMTKLKQGISPDLSKLLVKAKPEETMEVDHTERSATKCQTLPQSPRKGNLFENLTVIGATSATDKEEGKSEKTVADNGLVISEEVQESEGSDVELIEDSEFDKEEELILSDDNQVSEECKKSNLESPSDLKLVLHSCDKEDKIEKKASVAIKDEPKKPLPTTAEKPMEIDDDDEEEEEEEEEQEQDVEEVKIEDKKPIKIEVKKPIKIEVKKPIKIEVKKPIKIEDKKPVVEMKLSTSLEDSESGDVVCSSRSDRKRSQEDSSSAVEAPQKRSRLDMVIGKLGSQIGISPDTIKTDLSDEDSRIGSDISEKSDENTLSASDEDDDRTSQSSTKTIRLSGKELEALVRSKVSAYLKVERNCQTEALKSKIEELQAANESWKNQAKELQKQVLELTVLQQRLEKRKAATAALRQITTRSVAVQADDTKAVKTPKTPTKISSAPTGTAVSGSLLATNTTTVASTSTMASLLSAGLQTTVSTSGTTRSNMSQLLSATAAAVPRSSVATPTSLIGTPAVLNTSGVRPQLAQHLNTSTAPMLSTGTTVRSLLDTARADGTSNKLQSVNGQPISGANVIVVSSPPVAGQANTKNIANIPKVIDLTSDEDSAKASSAVTQTQPTVQVVPTSTMPTIRPGLVSQQVIRGVNPIALQPPLPTGGTFLLSSPGGPTNTYQIVTVASGSNLRPGTLLTVVPAGSPATTQQIRTAIPSTMVQKTVAGPVALPKPQLRHVTFTSTTVNSASPAQQAALKMASTIVPAPPVTVLSTTSTPTAISTTPTTPKHPAPLPAKPTNQIVRGIKGELPPKPGLKISRVSQGIVLSWNMTVQDGHAEIASYQLFAYQESSVVPSTSLWKKVGDVKALPLPMACTLTQFQEGNKYHFAVRAVDIHNRIGDFSDPSTIHLTPK